MASSQLFKAFVIVSLALAFRFQITLGSITCKNLDKDSCAFAISYFGKRCVLEQHICQSGKEVYICRTSEIEAGNIKDFIETDQCIEACGLDRHTFGISSDSLLEPRFIQKLCSPQCYTTCPNIVDLYFNLAAGEGVYLPKLCVLQGGNARREMVEVKSSGYAALGPVSRGVHQDLFFPPAMAPY